MSEDTLKPEGEEPVAPAEAPEEATEAPEVANEEKAAE